MRLLKLTERAALVLRCCERLQSDMDSEDHRRALADALEALGRKRPEGPPVVVGLFNQTVTLGDGALFHIARLRNEPTPEAKDSARRALNWLRERVFDLHAATARRAGVLGRPAGTAAAHGRMASQRTS
jgi:hypothetical protein